MLGDQEIEHRFGFHKGTIEGPNASVPRHREVRKLYKAFVKNIDQILEDDTREKALVMTALQEASMWTHCAIAMNAPLVDE